MFWSVTQKATPHPHPELPRPMRVRAFFVFARTVAIGYEEALVDEESWLDNTSQSPRVSSHEVVAVEIVELFDLLKSSVKAGRAFVSNRYVRLPLFPLSDESRNLT